MQESGLGRRTLKTVTEELHKTIIESGEQSLKILGGFHLFYPADKMAFRTNARPMNLHA
jgi:hypothetical protein